MKPIIYILTAGLLFVASQVFGQAIVTSLTPATVTAPIGSTVDLQLKVTNFNEVNSIQFPISFNPAVLEFDTIDNAALPGFVSGNYNAAPGKVTISWFADPGAYPTGFSVPDNSSIFTLHFKVLTNGTSAVNIANLPPGIEVIRNNVPVTLDYQNGGSQVTGGSGGSGPIQGFSIIANTIYIPQGATGCMPVTVNDFTSIVSMQYAMHWDSTILQYQTTQSYNLPGMGPLTFGGTPSSGLQLVGWDDPMTTGVTRANGTKIYDVCFKAIGPVGSSSLVTIDSIGFPPGNGSAEAFNAASQNVWTSTSGVKDTIFIVTAPPPPNAVTFTASKDTSETGTQVCVDVTVNNFNSIISMQYGLTYDATKLTYVSVTPGPSVPGLTATNFNPNTPGQITFSWFDPNVAGVTLPANTLLFTVCFTISAPTGTLIPINFGSLPGLPVEIVKEPDGPVNPAFVNGHVFVGTIVGPPGPTASINPTPACGGPNGSATANGAGGTPTSYAWSLPGSGNTQTISNLAAGDYHVTVTFVGGATATATATVQSGPAVTITSPQITNVKCHNETNGAISLTTGGGTTPYVSYAWTGPNNYTASTEDISDLAAGIYSFVATDSKGCTVAQNFTVTNPAALALSLATSQNVTCFNTPTGKVTINSGGGTLPLSYAWYTVPGGVLASGLKNPDNLPVGTYNVTITDVNQCTITLPNPVDITGPVSALSVATPIQKTDVVCWGYNTGAINVSISGGWSGNYSVSWDPNIPGGANPTGILAGTYNGTVTDQGGCQYVLPPVEVLGPPAIEDGDPIVVHNICANDGNGSINIQVSGGNGGPYMVEWNGGLQGESISNLAGGNYVPTITELNTTGCTAVLPGITVNEPSPIDTGSVVVVQPTTGNNDGAISPDMSGGTGALTFQWSGPGGFSANTEDISNLAAGIYILSATDASNCVFTASFVLGGALVVSITPTPSCGNDGCMNVQIAAGTPPFIISWTGTASGSFLTSDPTASICTFTPGVYNLTIADGANNTFSINNLNVDALEPALISSAVSPPIEDLGNGSIALTPVVPPPANFNYNWAGPNGFTSTSGTITGLDSGLYVVTVTNVNSTCTAVYSYPLVQDWPDIEFELTSAVSPNCNNTTDGSISINITGGNPSYTYAWSGPNGFTSDSADITGLFAGVYTVTVTDENGTTLTTSTTLTPQSQLAVTNVNETSSYGNPPYQVSGANQCDGVASVVFSGAVGATSILWSNNISAAQNTTLCAGPYSVSVTDALGCVSVWSDSLTYPPGVATTLSIVSEVSCHGECDGIARVFVAGGVAPYSVKWSTGQNDQVAVSGGFSQAVNLCGGDYKVSVVDKLGADYVFDIAVIAPPEIVLTFASVPSSTFNSCDAELIVEAPGAIGPITYNWSGSYGHSGEGQRAEGLCAGEIVDFIIYDANGCAGIGRDTIAYPEDGCYQVRPVITPGNQDGNNDFVFITCIEVVPNSIEIYNRWGQLVFETKGYDNSGNVWKGLTKNGQPLAEGVYFYVLNYTDPVRGQEQQKGHINLLR